MKVKQLNEILEEIISSISEAKKVIPGGLAHKIYNIFGRYDKSYSLEDVEETIEHMMDKVKRLGFRVDEYTYGISPFGKLEKGQKAEYAFRIQDREKKYEPVEVSVEVKPKGKKFKLEAWLMGEYF